MLRREHEVWCGSQLLIVSHTAEAARVRELLFGCCRLWGFKLSQPLTTTVPTPPSARALVPKQCSLRVCRVELHLTVERFAVKDQEH